MTPTIKNCIECGVILNSPSNWWLSFVGKQHYKCIDCYEIRRTENIIKRKYKEGKQPSSKLLAKLLGTRHKAEYNKIENGYVYIISNPAWEGWFKVGMALDASDRCSVYQTSSPFRDYVVRYSKYFEDRRSSEQQIHAILTKEKLERRGEWFKGSLSDIKSVIKQH